MQNAGIRIAHSLAVFEMRDCSPMVNDRHASASGPSCCRAETGARHRVARGGFLCAPRVSRAGAARCAAGSFDDFANPAPDRSGNARSRLHLDLAAARDVGLVKGKTIGIDATTLKANAALRSIVRRDTGDTYQEFLTQLAQASGIATPPREDLARIDRKRPKKDSSVAPVAS